MEPAPRAGSDVLPGCWAPARAARSSLLLRGRPALRASRRAPAGEGARARAPRPLPAPLPPGRLRGLAGRRSRERAVQRAAAAQRPPGFPSLPARPPLSAPLRACSLISGTRLVRPHARSLLAPALPAPSSASSRPALRGDPPRLAGAGTRAPQANHRPGWGAGRGRGGGGVRPQCPPHPLAPLRFPAGSPSREAGPLGADPPSPHAPAFPPLWGAGGLGIWGR